MMNSSYVGKPEVSVLMPCYNADRWLVEAIESVLAQSFKNFEFILVDDGSTDETCNIIKSYRDRDERIIAISKEHTNLSDSLNLGIAQARGEWIARLDADDLCGTTRLEEQINFVRNHTDVVLLGAGFLEIDEHSRVIKRQVYPTSHQTLLRHLERLQRFFPHSSAFYRADTARQTGGYNMRFSRPEDLQLWLKMSLRGQIACLPKLLVCIRKHAGQISHDDNGRRQLYDSIAGIICHFLGKAGYKDLSNNDTNEIDWSMFLKWVETQIDASLAFVRLKAWGDARTLYYAAGSKVTGSIRFTSRLLKSGHAGALVWNKLYGSSLPRHLAQKWMNLQ